MSTPPNEAIIVADAGKKPALAAGIDIGNSRCVVATSTAGIATVVQNQNDGSGHETPAVIRFTGKQRLFGTLGASNATMNPASTISQLKRLLGRRRGDAGLDAELRRLHYPTSWDDHDRLRVEVPYGNGKRAFTSVEMLGMLLAHVRRTAEGSKGSGMSECVLAVPGYFTPEQMMAYVDAARMAGWNPLGLLHEGAAAAVEYGASWKDVKGCVAFVDVGHSDTQVTVVQFEGERRNVLVQAHDRDLGGRDFDDIIFDHFVGRFWEKYGIDVGSSNVTAKLRLRVECEKAKETLSASKEAVVSVDSLIGGVDAKGVISRKEFETLSSNLVSKIMNLFSQALEVAGVRVEQVDSVELIGSASRIPAIWSSLSLRFGTKVCRKLKASECIALGCAAFCEMLMRGRDAGCEDPEKKVAERFGFSKGEFTPGTISKNDMLQAQQIEAELASQDANIERAKDARNSLESNIKCYREKVLELARKFQGLPPDVLLNVSEAFEKTELWLQLDGNDEYTDEDYKLKMNDMMTAIEKSLVKAAATRGDTEHSRDDGCKTDQRKSPQQRNECEQVESNSTMTKTDPTSEQANMYRRKILESYISRIRSGLEVITRAVEKTESWLGAEEGRGGCGYYPQEYEYQTNQLEMLIRRITDGLVISDRKESASTDTVSQTGARGSLTSKQVQDLLNAAKAETESNNAEHLRRMANNFSDGRQGTNVGVDEAWWISQEGGEKGNKKHRGQSPIPSVQDILKGLRRIVRRRGNEAEKTQKETPPDIVNLANIASTSNEQDGRNRSMVASNMDALQAARYDQGIPAEGGGWNTLVSNKGQNQEDPVHRAKSLPNPPKKKKKEEESINDPVVVAALSKHKHNAPGEHSKAQEKRGN